jgi:hypothetical protein
MKKEGGKHMVLKGTRTVGVETSLKSDNGRRKLKGKRTTNKSG